jgi:hypothetical protein
MPFGLRNASASFQRFINSILGDLSFVFAYIDDILIFSSLRKEYYRHLEKVFERLVAYNLTINLDKCKFFVPKLTFLGHRITRDGFTLTEERIEAIKKTGLPATITDL